MQYDWKQNYDKKECGVRIINFVDKSIKLDIFLGGVMIANSLPYARCGEYVRIKAGVMNAVVLINNTSLRLYNTQLVNTKSGGLYTMIITGSTWNGSIWMVEDNDSYRSRRIRLVQASESIRSATLTVVGKIMLKASFRQATQYTDWPNQNGNIILRAEYAQETMRVRIQEKKVYENKGTYSVYLFGARPSPPEAIVVREGW